jgi:hypothetical protein
MLYVGLYRIGTVQSPVLYRMNYLLIVVVDNALEHQIKYEMFVVFVQYLGMLLLSKKLETDKDSEMLL